MGGFLDHAHGSVWAVHPRGVEPRLGLLHQPQVIRRVWQDSAIFMRRRVLRCRGTIFV